MSNILHHYEMPPQISIHACRDYCPTMQWFSDGGNYAQGGNLGMFWGNRAICNCLFELRIQFGTVAAEIFGYINRDWVCVCVCVGNDTI